MGARAQFAFRLFGFKNYWSVEMVITDIPEIEDMRADIALHRVYSEIQTIDVCCVGNERPEVFGPPLQHVDGYQRYVSKHFALHADVAADDARFYLQCGMRK